MQAILLVGADEMLLKTRSAVLSTTGTEVVSSDATSSLAMLAERKFDLAVLCHSLTPEASTPLAKAMRGGSPRTRILQLVAQRVWWEEFDPQGIVDATCSADPKQLVAMTEHLLERSEPEDIREVAVRGGVVRAGPYAYGHTFHALRAAQTRGPLRDKLASGSSL
jgi:DNA-binding response OmpR family regulator